MKVGDLVVSGTSFSRFYGIITGVRTNETLFKVHWLEDHAEQGLWWHKSCLEVVCK